MKQANSFDAPLPWALIAFLVAAAAIVGAWLFQWAGYQPCELCLKERWPYYFGAPLAGLAALVCWRGPRRLERPLLVLVGLVFLASAAFGAYHAGVEWGFWKGPADCTGHVAKAANMSDFMAQLKTIKVVRCDAVAIRILGLSLAGWNVVASLIVVAAAWIGATRRRASL